MFSIAARSDIGLVRDNNEDNLLIDEEMMPEGGEVHYHYDVKVKKISLICAVCDGMGGQLNGEAASYEAVRRLKEAARSALPGHNLENRIRNINDCISNVNSNLYNREPRVSGGKGMGTTIACLLSYDGEAVAMHVGDSRIYHYRNGVNQQLTVDHSENERLMRLGILSPEQARRHPSRSMLTRYLGMLPSDGLLEADVSGKIKLEPGDIFLLCSDGLTDMIDPDSLQRIMASAQKITIKADELLAKALSSGGKDNITLILIRVIKPFFAPWHDLGNLSHISFLKWLVYAVALITLFLIGYSIGFYLSDFL